MISIDRIYEAKQILAPIIRKTPMMQLGHSDLKVFLKAENLQRTGSFKIRGAFNKIANLSEEEKSRGVIACSAGNHAQGVALSATRNHTKSTICIPSLAPLAKVEATKDYGGDVVLVDGDYDDAYEKALELQADHGYTFIHPFDDELVMAGQGTIGLEMLQDLDELDAVIVPIGGGGLISGVACAIKSLKPKCKVIGVQTSKIASMKASLEKGEIVSLAKASTLGDGIAVRTPGKLTFEAVNRWVDEIVTVDEEEIAYAILHLMEFNKMVVEGAAAASLAAVMFDKVSKKGNICVLISGGNVDVNILSKIISLGSFKSGRLTEITTAVTDRPGELMAFLGLLKKMGTNILTIDQYSDHAKANVASSIVRVVVESRNRKHQEEIYEQLTQAGYDLLFE